MKKILSILLILFSLFLILELSQRCRHTYRNKSIAPLCYGAERYWKVLHIYKQKDSFFRQPYIILEKNQGKNLLFIGSSSTYGGYNDDFHTFPYLLQTKFDGISCLNAARSGTASKRYLNILLRCCKKFCIPDMVIFYVGYNDIFVKNPYTEIRVFKLINGLVRYSFLVMTIKEKLFFLDLEKKKDSQYRMRYVKEFEKNLEDCIKFAQSKDIKVVLIPEVLIAERFSSYNDYRWYKPLYLEIPEVLEKLAQKYNCYFLDPKNVLYPDWRNNFVDTVHLTDKGNEVFSEFLAHNLRFEK